MAEMTTPQDWRDAPLSEIDRLVADLYQDGDDMWLSRDDLIREVNQLVNDTAAERLLWRSDLDRCQGENAGLRDQAERNRAHIIELEAEVERLREEQRWIPVSERLPERDDEVAVLWRWPVSGELISDLTHWTGGLWACDPLEVIAWHPLPPLPPEVTE